jgi:GNAT superfamily N-acetyltransferase
MDAAPYTIVPLTPERWPDIERLFGPRGACGGCWCMYWRLSHAVYEAQLGETNRLHFRMLVESGQEPGLLAYAGDQAVGWCALAPRQEYHRLKTSRILKPVDDRPVWSVVCFFVHRLHRRNGLTGLLLRAAIESARQHGAQILEAYPVEPKEASAPAPFIFPGVASTFRQAGFVEVARRSPTRPVMRYYLEPAVAAEG